MNKGELAAAVADKLGGTEVDARRYVDAVFEAIMVQVAAGERVQVLGFGTFDRVERAARIGRNPQTGASIQVPAGTSPRFHAGQTFRTRVTGTSEQTGAEVAVQASPAVKVVKAEKKKAAKPVKAEKRVEKKAENKAKPAGKKPGKAAPATVKTKTGPAKKAGKKTVKTGKSGKK
jgi:DNA-binding protein HU-beta